MKKKLIRAGVLAVLVVAGFLLQTNLPDWVPYLRVAPNLLLIITFSIGFLRGRIAGMFCGLACGLLSDAFGGGILGYYTLIFIYIGYLNGLLSNIMVDDMILLPLILCLINEICYSVYVYLFGAFLLGKANFPDYIRTIAVPELIITLFCTVILYGLILFFHHRLEAREKTAEERSLMLR